MEQIENAALDFEFLGGGVTPVECGSDTGRRQFPFYVLVNNDGMSSTAEYGGRAIGVNDGEGYLVPRDRVHRLRTREGAHPVSVWCHFRATLFHSADFLDLFELPEKFLPPDSGRIREACRALVVPPELESPARRLLRRKSAGLRLIEAITAACRERADAPERFDTLRRLAPAIDFMNRRLDGTHRLEEAAARANLSESRFTVLFKQAMNCAPGAYWQSLRLRRAHELLSSGATPAETAVELGFYDVFHFSRGFKRHFGVTPAEFQRRRRERTLPF